METANATAAIASGIATWRLRSPVRSEWREMSTRPTIATVYGIAVTKPFADVAEPVDLVDDLADPEREAVDVDDHAEVQEAEHEHAPVLERLADRVALALRARRSSPSRRSASQRFSSSCEPVRVLRARRRGRGQTKHAGERRPGSPRSGTATASPSSPATPSKTRHDPAGDRRADGVGDRDRRHEEADRAGALAGREPVARGRGSCPGKKPASAMPSRKRTA